MGAKILSTFSGIGCQERGLQKAFKDIEVVGTSEIDREALVSYACIHHGLTKEMIENYKDYPSEEEMRAELTEKNIGYVFEKNQPYNWNRVKGYNLKKYWLANKLNKNLGDISKVDVIKEEIDIFTFSFPCFVGDTLVLSDKGYKQIKDLKVGDKVLSHDNNFHEVQKVINNGKKEIFKIKGMACNELRTTENHRFYIRTRRRVWDNERRSYDRVFDEPQWKEAKDLTKSDYLGYAINKNSIIPTWSKPENGYFKDISGLMDNKDFWWLMGRYVADGWCRSQGGIVIACRNSKLDELTEKIKQLDFSCCVTDKRINVCKCHIPLKELSSFVKQFGYKADGKFIPSSVLDLPIDLLRSFFDGYMSGDGYCDKKKDRFKASSVSKELIFGLGQIVAKIYNRPFSIYHIKRKPTCVIEGRVVN